MLDWKEIYSRLLEAVSEDRMLQDVRALHVSNSRMSFSAYAETARWLASRLEEAGLASRRYPYPANGVTRIGGRVVPLAWDVEGAELRLREADGKESTLVSFDERPYSVVMFSPCTDGWQEAPLVYFEPKEPHKGVEWKDEEFKSLPLRGCCVLLGIAPGPLLIEGLVRQGAVAFVTDGKGPRSAHHQKQPEALRWDNEAFGEGMITASRVRLPGFSTSPHQSGQLTEKLKSGEPLTVRFRTQSKTYEGELNMVSGTLAGARRPEERVFLLAHLYEPNVTNNCSGVAILVAAMEALNGLVESGSLSPPSRSIELLSSMEMFGIVAHATMHPEIRDKGIAGLALDCLIRQDGREGAERIEMDSSFDASPSFINALLGELLAHLSRQTGVEWVERNGVTGNEDTLSDPSLGPPTALLSGAYQFVDGTYHTDSDALDRLDSKRMAHVSALIGTAAYAIAAAAEEEALWFAEKAYDRSRRRIVEMKEAVVAGRMDCLEQRLSFLVEIETKALTSVLRLAENPASLQQRVEALCDSLRSFAQQEVERVDSTKNSASASSQEAVLWEQASRIVPVRTVAGPVCFQNLSAEVRAEYETLFGRSINELEWYGGAPTLFWVEGERNLAEVCMLSRLSSEELMDGNALKELMDFYSFLERNGYMHLKRE